MATVNFEEVVFDGYEGRNGTSDLAGVEVSADVTGQASVSIHAINRAGNVLAGHLNIEASSCGKIAREIVVAGVRMAPERRAEIEAELKAALITLQAMAEVSFDDEISDYFAPAP